MKISWRAAALAIMGMIISASMLFMHAERESSIDPLKGDKIGEGGRITDSLDTSAKIYRGGEANTDKAREVRTSVELPILGLKSGSRRSEDITYFDSGGDQISGKWNIYSNENGWFFAEIQKDPTFDRARGLAAFEYLHKHTHTSFIIEAPNGSCSEAIEDILGRACRAFPNIQEAKRIDLTYLRASNASLSAVKDTVLVLAWGEDVWVDLRVSPCLGLAVFVEVNGSGVLGEPIGEVSGSDNVPVQ